MSDATVSVEARKNIWSSKAPMKAAIVAEYDRLALAPVLVVDLSAVLRRDDAHSSFPFLLRDGVARRGSLSCVLACGRIRCWQQSRSGDRRARLSGTSAVTSAEVRGSSN